MRPGDWIGLGVMMALVFLVNRFSKQRLLSSGTDIAFAFIGFSAGFF